MQLVFDDPVLNGNQVFADPSEFLLNQATGGGVRRIVVPGGRPIVEEVFHDEEDEILAVIAAFMQMQGASRAGY